jgi:excisionase family DNA binding protein
MTGDILTLQQASELLKIDADTLRVLARRGKVPAMKVGRQWRFDEGLLREWVRERSLSGLTCSGSKQQSE